MPEGDKKAEEIKVTRMLVRALLGTFLTVFLVSLPIGAFLVFTMGRGELGFLIQYSLAFSFLMGLGGVGAVLRNRWDIPLPVGLDAILEQYGSTSEDQNGRQFRLWDYCWIPGQGRWS